MIPPHKRKDLSVTLVVSPELRQDLVELAESGAIDVEACSVSQALRVLLPAVMGRMEAGEALAASPYERVAYKQGVRLSFRHDKAFAERVGALRVSDEGGRGALSPAAFWVELLGRAVALARAGELEARAEVAGESEAVAIAGAVPVAPSSTSATPFSLSPDQWAELQQRFQERVAESRAAKRVAAAPPAAPATSADEPSTEAVFMALMRAQRAVLAAHDERPPPSGEPGPDADLVDLVEEGVRMFTEMLDIGNKRGR